MADLLRDGPVAAERVYADAKGAGHSERAIRRAQQALSLEATLKGAVPGFGGCPPATHRETTTGDLRRALIRQILGDREEGEI